MGKTKKRIKVSGVMGELEVDALFDTGSTRCHIINELADKIGMISTSVIKDVGVMGDVISDQPLYRMKVIIDDCVDECETFVWDKDMFPEEEDGTRNEIIIGHQLMQKMGVVEITVEDMPTIVCKSKRSIWYNIK